MPKKETIRVRPPREEDRGGDPIGPVPAWREIPGAIVVPRSSDEYEQRGAIIVSGFMVVLGPTTPDSLVTKLDEIEVRGEVYQIDGEIADYIKKRIFYVTRPN